MFTAQLFPFQTKHEESLLAKCADHEELVLSAPTGAGKTVLVSKFIDDYLDENPKATIQDIEDQFGTPMEIAQSYMSSLDLDVLLKRLSISRFIRRFFAIAAICMILGLCVYSICMYKAYICYKDTLVTNSETVIVD